MYNRYVRNDQGQYSRLPQEEMKADKTAESSVPPPRPTVAQENQRPSPSNKQRPAELRFLDGVLDKLHLSDIDAGDLILLVLLFLLFRENGDEELLIALGLLLIL